MKENSEITLKECELTNINLDGCEECTTRLKRGKSIIKIGNSKLGGTTVEIVVSTKFNWLQKKLWKYLLNIDIKDIKEDE